MTIDNSKSKLEKFYAFFQTYGTERLNGLGESYFVGMNDDEKEEAWRGKRVQTTRKCLAKRLN